MLLPLAPGEVKGASLMALRSNQYPNMNSNNIRSELSSMGASSPGSSSRNESIQILYSHPYSKIVSFTVTGNNSHWDTEQHLLPFTNLTDSTIAKGPIKLYRAKPHNTAFIQSGKTVHPVMAKSTCWCVEEVIGKGVWGRGRGKGVFVFRIRLGTYWRVEINEAGMVGAVEEFKNALRGVLAFEKEDCPFVRVDVVLVGQDEREKEKELRKKEKEWIAVKQSMDTPKAKDPPTPISPFLSPKSSQTKPPISGPSGGLPPTPLPSPALESFGSLLPLPMPDPIKSDMDLALRPYRPSPLTFGPLRGLSPPTPLLSPYFPSGMVSFDDVLPVSMRNGSYVHLSELNTTHTCGKDAQYRVYGELSELLNGNHTVGQDLQSYEQTPCGPSPISTALVANSPVDSLGLSIFAYSTPTMSDSSPPAEAPDRKPQKEQREPSYRQPWVLPQPKATTETTLANSETTFVTTYGDDSNLLDQLGSVIPQSGKMLSATAEVVILQPSIYLAGFMQKMVRSVVGGGAVKAGPAVAEAVEAGLTGSGGDYSGEV